MNPITSFKPVFSECYNSKQEELIIPNLEKVKAYSESLFVKDPEIYLNPEQRNMFLEHLLETKNSLLVKKFCVLKKIHKRKNHVAKLTRNAKSCGRASTGRYKKRNLTSQAELSIIAIADYDKILNIVRKQMMRLNEAIRMCTFAANQLKFVQAYKP